MQHFDYAETTVNLLGEINENLSRLVGKFDDLFTKLDELGEASKNNIKEQNELLISMRKTFR